MLFFKLNSNGTHGLSVVSKKWRMKNRKKRKRKNKKELVSLVTRELQFYSVTLKLSISVSIIVWAVWRAELMLWQISVNFFMLEFFLSKPEARSWSASVRNRGFFAFSAKWKGWNVSCADFFDRARERVEIGVLWTVENVVGLVGTWSSWARRASNTVICGADWSLRFYCSRNLILQGAKQEKTYCIGNITCMTISIRVGRSTWATW